MTRIMICICRSVMKIRICKCRSVTKIMNSICGFVKVKVIREGLYGKRDFLQGIQLGL